MRGCQTYNEIDFGYGRRYSSLALIELQEKVPLGLEGGIVDYGITAGNADADMACAMVYRKFLKHLCPKHMAVEGNA